MKNFLPISLLTSAAILAIGVYAALLPPDVYGPADQYVVERRPDGEGRDRIYIYATVKKLRNCDLESGLGPPWVEFYDSEFGVPPPSAFYHPDGSPSGTTRAGQDETIPIDGYSAIVPSKMSGAGGFFRIRVPCQLWTLDAGGNRVWGRKVVGEYGPIPMPLPGEVSRGRRSLQGTKMSNRSTSPASSQTMQSIAGLRG